MRRFRKGRCTEADRPPNVDVLCFLTDKKRPGDLWEDDAAARAWGKNFRDGLNRNAKFFRSEDDPRLPGFRALVSLELANHRNRVALAPQPVDADVADIELRRVLRLGEVLDQVLLGGGALEDLAHANQRGGRDWTRANASRRMSS